ncbi:MAG: hypothetical protein AAFY41_07040 [Bacteroidota bacterium]
MNKKDINGHPHVSYERDVYELNEAEHRAKAYYQWLDTRRTVREISNKHISKDLIENLIMAGSTAPSGAHPTNFFFKEDTNLR